MSYKNVNTAYFKSARENFINTHEHEHAHDSSVHFNELIKKTYENKGAFGYICVQKPDSDKIISNWETDPDLECSWTFVSPNLLRREGNNPTKKIQQAKETHNIKHYVLSRDVNKDGNFIGDISVDDAKQIITGTGAGSESWSQFSQ